MTLGRGARSGTTAATTLTLPEGSWGEGGDHRVWLNPDTEWTWDRVYGAEDEWVGHLARARRPGTAPSSDRVLCARRRGSCCCSSPPTGNS